jgi:hypothetical protein
LLRLDRYYEIYVDLRGVVLNRRSRATVVALLGAAELSATRAGLALSVAKISPVEVAAHLMTLLAGSTPDPVEAASRVCNKLVEKFDVWLPDELLVAE